MRYSLLDIVQAILSSLDSDEVNSINDTVESHQAAVVARTAYLNIATIAGLSVEKTLFELEPSLDPLLPTVMYKPENITNIDWLKYNKATDDQPTIPDFSYVDYLPVESFFQRMHFLSTLQTNTESGTLTIGDDSITLFWKNDVSPLYYTSFNDNTILFDSYDKEVEATLQKTKTLGYGEADLVFEMDDDFIPNLDDKHHQLWLNEAKSLAWAELKQTVHAKAEQAARKGWINVMKTRRGIPTVYSELNRLPNYGRRGGYGPRYTPIRKKETW